MEPAKLSPRESEVLTFLLEGESNRQISRKLHISTNTVKTHVTHIFNKLGVENRTQAAVAAVTLNLTGRNPFTITGSLPDPIAVD